MQTTRQDRRGVLSEWIMRKIIGDELLTAITSRNLRIFIKRYLYLDESFIDYMV